MAPDSDFLDGCEIDFAEHAVDESTVEMLPLFPVGVDDVKPVLWRSLFAAPQLAAIVPFIAAVYDGSGYDVGIADRLRAAGLRVVEIDGWRTRGSSTFAPRGSVDHHTAGSRAGNAPSLNVCIHGRADLPGPLCQVLVGRDLTCYVIAAGRANHAGLGGWRGLIGNSSVYGVERENVGTPAEPWTAAQTVHAARVHGALAGGRFDGRTLCRHAEWAPTRKIDTHTISGTTLRALFSQPNPEEPDMDQAQDKRLRDVETVVRRMEQTLVPRQPRRVVTSGADIGKLSPNGDPVSDLWRWALAAELERQGRTSVLVDRIAKAVVAALPPSQGGVPLTIDNVSPLVDGALRSVLGGLDDT